LSSYDIKINGTEHFVNIADGQTVRVVRTGQGEPLVLMHTIRTQIEYFHQIIPTLAQKYAVYAIDLPGHGESSNSNKINYDEPYLRKSVIDVINQLRLNNVTLVGESIGATLSLTVAASIPEKIKQVVAINTYDYEKRYADGIRRGSFIANFLMWHFSIPGVGAVFAALENSFILGLVMNGGVTNIKKMPISLVKLFNKTGHKPGYRYVERNILANWRSWAKAPALYHKVRCPVTFVYGENDWSSSKEASATSSKIPQSKIEFVPNSGHFLSVDNTEVLKEVINKHMIT
jgi:pimeloyl-ACP methyl ester carboxylesterase